MKHMKRRSFLKGSLTAVLAVLATGAGLLNPRRLLAAWPASAFDAKKVPDTLELLFGNTTLIPSQDISLTIPELAENGAVVPVTVASKLADVESITLLVDKNPNALIARFTLAKNTLPYIKTNIKMAETSNVIAVLKVGDKLYSASKKIKVIMNGCGN